MLLAVRRPTQLAEWLPRGLGSQRHSAAKPTSAAPLPAPRPAPSPGADKAALAIRERRDQTYPGQRITSPSFGNALKFAGLRCGLVMRWPPMSASPLARSEDSACPATQTKRARLPAISAASSTLKAGRLALELKFVWPLDGQANSSFLPPSSA